MEMTFKEYSDNIFSLIETAIYNYEIEVMVEDAESTEIAKTQSDDNAAAEKKASKLESLKKFVIGAIKKVIAFLKNGIAKLIFNLKKIGGAIELPENKDEKGNDIPYQFYPGVFGFDSKLMGYIDEACSNNFSNYEKALAYFDGIKENEYKAGSKVPTSSILSSMQKYNAALERVDSKLSSFGNNVTDSEILNKAKEIFMKAKNVLGAYVSQGNKIVGLMMGAGREKAEAKKNSANTQVNAEAHEKAMNERTTTESVDYNDLSLLLLAESARLLSEDADSVSDGSYQDPIDDIPEEKPVDTDEYDADNVSGGKGQMDDEAIKEIVDDEGIKIATDDSGSSITESVIITF